MNFNYQAPPQSSASDRQKYKITQDDIIAVQIANDANIANARNQQFVLKVPQALTPIESMSPEQLLADEAGQEMLAQQNLKQLKFRDQEVADIMVNIRRDPQLSFLLLNSNFPAIKAELEKRFNLKLVTPTFFLDFLKAYLAKVSKSLGLTQYSRNKNDSVDTVEELKTILPDINDLQFLKQQAQNLNYDPALLERLDDLIDGIPSDQDYADILNLDMVTRQEAMRELLTLTRDLPTSSQVSSLVQGIQSGSVDRRSFNDAMMKLLNSIDLTFRKPQLRQEVPPRPRRAPPLTPDLQQIEQEMGEMLKRRLEPATPISLKADPQFTTPIKPTRNFLNSPESLPLKDIKNYFKENPNLAAQLKDTKSGEKVRYGKLTKTQGRAGVWIYDTNLFELWGQDEPPTTEGYGIGKYNNLQQQPRNRIRIGKGISAVEQPSYKEFGKFCINIPHLENQDILNVKYKNCLGAIPSFKPTAVSDIFRDFIVDLLDSGKPNTRVYNQISDEERKYFQKVATAAGIFKGMGLPNTVIDDEEKDVKRFEILRGQITAGNNNPKLLDETRKLVVKLMNADRIKKKQGLDILLELSAM
jgi:hypothetical protein